jgi:hypothetical protein
LLGKDAGGLSASTIGRLKDTWSDEHARWSKRDLSAADSDEAGHAFQFEAGHPFRDEAGHGSDLKSATWRSPCGSSR